MPESLKIALKNDSDSSNLHVYISGLAIQHQNQRCFLKTNGKDLYFPQQVSSTGSPLADDVAIPLGKPGSTVTVTIPQIAGGRIYVAEGHLTFLLNPGPSLVEPSVLNPSDPNSKVNFGFCEFTLNNEQLYANISYVDFVPRIPISIALEEPSGQSQYVSGMPPNGLDELAKLMAEQTKKDHQPWDKLLVKHDNRNLRILNATHGNAVGASFDGYYEPYVEEVWKKFKGNAKMTINTQAAAGIVNGHVDDKGEFIIGGEPFSKPNTADILGCNSGPFTTGPSAERNAIIPRLAAAFVRSTMLSVEHHPSPPDTYYKTNPTNHYSRLAHEVNLDKKGYAFAYDDVQPDGGKDVSGKVNSGDPKLFTVAVGGKGATAKGPKGHAAVEEKVEEQPPAPAQQNGQQQPLGAQPEEEHKGLGGKIKGLFKH